MNRPEREAVSRLAMFVLSALLLVGGAALIYTAVVIVRPYESDSNPPGYVSERLLLFGLALVGVGGYFLVMCFVPSVDTDRQPTDEQYRIK